MDTESEVRPFSVNKKELKKRKRHRDNRRETHILSDGVAARVPIHSMSSNLQECVDNNYPSSIASQTHSYSLSKKLVTVNDVSHSGGTAFISNVPGAVLSTRPSCDVPCPRQPSGFPTYRSNSLLHNNHCKQTNNINSTDEENAEDNNNNNNNDKSLNCHDSPSSTIYFEAGSCTKDLEDARNYGRVISSNLEMSKQPLFVEASNMFIQKQSNNDFQECDPEFSAHNATPQSMFNFPSPANDSDNEISDQSPCNLGLDYSCGRLEILKSRRHTNASNGPEDFYDNSVQAVYTNEHASRYAFQKQQKIEEEPGATRIMFKKYSPQSIQSQGVMGDMDIDIDPQSQTRCSNLPACSFQDHQQNMSDCKAEAGDKQESPAAFLFTNDGRSLSQITMTPSSDVSLQNPTLSMFENDVLSTSEFILMSPHDEDGTAVSLSNNRKTTASCRKGLPCKYNKQMSSCSLEPESRGSELEMCQALSPLLNESCSYQKSQPKIRGDAYFTDIARDIQPAHRAVSSLAGVSQNCHFEISGTNAFHPREVVVPAGKNDSTCIVRYEN